MYIGLRYKLIIKVSCIHCIIEGLHIAANELWVKRSGFCAVLYWLISAIGENVIEIGTPCPLVETHSQDFFYRILICCFQCKINGIYFLYVVNQCMRKNMIIYHYKS